MLMRDVYWLAGLVEGEGCYRYAKDARQHLTGSVQLAVACAS
jgi:hypothetical protein